MLGGVCAGEGRGGAQSGWCTAAPHGSNEAVKGSLHGTHSSSMIPTNTWFGQGGQWDGGVCVCVCVSLAHTLISPPLLPHTLASTHALRWLRRELHGEETENEGGKNDQVDVLRMDGHSYPARTKVKPTNVWMGCCVGTYSTNCALLSSTRVRSVLTDVVLLRKASEPAFLTSLFFAKARNVSQNVVC